MYTIAMNQPYTYENVIRRALPNEQIKDRDGFKKFTRIYYENLKYQGVFLWDTQIWDLRPAARRAVVGMAYELWKSARRGI